MTLKRLMPAMLLAALPCPAWAISCSFVSVSGVSFGAYDVFSSSPLDTTGTITIICTSVGGTDNITVDLSQGGASSFSPRQLARSGGGVLDYNLYVDAPRTTTFGDGTSGTAHYGPTNPPDNTNVAITVYGRIGAQQDVPGGSYSDTVVATINY